MSAVAPGLATAGSDLTAGTTAASGSWTPTGAGNLVLITVYHLATTPTALTSIASDTLTSVKVVAGNTFATGHRLDVYAAISTAATDTVDFTFAESTTAAVWRVQEILNADMNRGFWSAFHSGVTGIAQIGTGTSGTGNTASLSFGRNPQHATNAFFTFYAFDNASHATNEAGWTETFDENATGAFNLNIESQYRLNTTDLTNTATLTATPHWGSLGVEVWGEDGSGDFVARETFTKADGVGWTADQVWSQLSIGNLLTSGNQATSSTSIVAYGRMEVDSSSANHEAAVQATIMELGTASYVGLRVRSAADSTDAYEYNRVGAATLSGFTVTLRKLISTNVTVLGNLTIPRAALDTPEILYMTVIGNTITCYLDGVQVLAATDTSLPTKLRGGLAVRGSASNMTFADNFAFGDIGKARPQVTLAAEIPTSASAKAAPRVAKRIAAKIPTANGAKTLPFGRVTRIRARIETATTANAYTIVTAAEAFNVKRPLIAKVSQSISVRGALGAARKEYQTKVPFSVAGGGVFSGAVLDVEKGIVESTWPNANSAEATVQRGVGFEGKMFQSSSALGIVTGRTGFDASIPISSHAFSYISGRVPYIVFIPNSDGIISDFVLIEGQLYLHNPLEYDIPSVLPETKGPARALFRFYASRPSGVNVFIYSNGLATTVEPDGYSLLWRDSDRTPDTDPAAATVLRVFWGGHDAEVVSHDEAILLTTAGFDVRTYA